MKSPDSLFNLIKVLTPAEKGYFKKYVQHNENKPTSYIRLFDAINAQEIYDEEKLKKKIGKDLSNFSAAKNYLYDSILNSLIVSHRQTDLYSQMTDSLVKADILAMRHLSDESIEYLDKAHVLADKNFEPSIHLQAFDRLLMIATVQNNLELLQELTTIGLQRAMGWVENLRTDVLIRQAVSWLGLYRMLYAGPSSDEERKAFLKEAKKFIATLKPLRLTTHHQLTFEQLNAVINEESGDFKKGYKHLKKILQLINHPDLYQNDMNINRIIVYWNTASYCLRHFPAEAMQYINKLDEVVQRSYNPSHRMTAMAAERFWYTLQIRYYNMSGDVERAAHWSHDIQKWYQKNEKSIPKRISAQMFYELAFHYFTKGDYSKTMLNLQNVINNTESERNVRLSALVMQMMVHYDTGDAEYIEPLIKPLSDELKEFKLGDSFYQAAYDCLVQAVNNPDPRKVHGLLMELLKKIESSLPEIYSRNTALMKVFLPWLQSKRHRISFQEAVKQNFEMMCRRKCQ